MSLPAALMHPDAPDAPPSPCTGLCRIAAASGWCEGCHRTLDEISRWRSASAADQHAIWRAIRQREQIVTMQQQDIDGT